MKVYKIFHYGHKTEYVNDKDTAIEKVKAEIIDTINRASDGHWNNQFKIIQKNSQIIVKTNFCFKSGYPTTSQKTITILNIA